MPTKPGGPPCLTEVCAILTAAVHDALADFSQTPVYAVVADGGAGERGEVAAGAELDGAAEGDGFTVSNAA